VGPVGQNYTPPDAEIAWYLGRFIAHVRNLSSDHVIVRRNWLATYDYSTGYGAIALNQSGTPRLRTGRGVYPIFTPSSPQSP
jgi:type IV secretion system protein TrbF